MTTYTVRVTNDNGEINAWIDLNGQICIKQPHAPGKTENWSSEEEARAWANAHVVELETQYNESLAAAALAEERAAAQHAANLAAIDTAEALKALVAHLAR